MKENKYNNLTEYEKAINFIKTGCNCGCSNKIPKEEFSELRENFQALTKPEQDIFLMAQLRSMNSGEINTSQRLKRNHRLIKGLFIAEIVIHSFVKRHILICLVLVTNIREHLVKNGLLF